MWPNAYRTPQYVWSISAIAATALHAGGLWWFTTYWQNSQSPTSPPAIEVIAIPSSDVAAIAPPTNPTGLPQIVPQLVKPEPETTPDTPASDAVSDTPIPQVPASNTPAPDNSAAPIQSRPNSSNPAAPTASSTNPAQATPGSSNPAQFPQAAPEPTTRPSQPPPVAPTEQQNLLIQWGAPQLPSGARNLPQGPNEASQTLPTYSENWQAITSALLKDSECFTNLVSSVPSVQITFQPTIEVDGSLSEIRLVNNSVDLDSDVLANCLETLRSQMPPLIPATDGGIPIRTDLVYLTIGIDVAE